MFNISSFNKINYLLTKDQKKRMIFLAFLLLIGMLFEMVGLAIILPVVSLISSENPFDNYPLISSFIFEEVGISGNSLIYFGMIILLFVYLLKSLFLVYLSWKQASFSSDFSAALSRKLFFGYLSQTYSFHLQRNSAELLRNIQNETNQFMVMSLNAITLSLEVVVLIGIAVTLIYLEPTGALVVALFFGIAGYVFVKITKKKLRRWGKDRLYHDGQSTQHLLQGFGGIKEVKVMGLEPYFLSSFEKHNTSKAEIFTKQIALQQVPRIYLEFLAVCSLAAIVIFMNLSFSTTNTVFPILSVFVAAAFRSIPSVNRILISIQAIRFNKSVIDLFYKEFYLINSLVPKTTHEVFSRVKFNDSITLRNVFFKYEDAETYALTDISIEIKKGEMIGLIGQTGSGKSTLVDLILGLLPPLSGEVLFDNENIEINSRFWQDHIGYVPQTIYLTDESLKKNIAFGLTEDQIDDVAVSRVLKVAQLDELVDGLPEGLDTIVGERGVRLSGGQRQRIGIARSLYRNPAILVLDEATSALDIETEKAVMDSIKLYQGMKTIIIIAHRLPTLKNCDRVYVLAHGKIQKHGNAIEILSNYP